MALPGVGEFDLMMITNGASNDEQSQPDGEPDSVVEALRRQLILADKCVAEGATIGGWKVGLTSRGGRDRLGPNVRPFGFILKDRVFSSGQCIALSELESCGIEPELCFTMGRKVEGPLTSAEVRESVSSVAPAFEINEWRSTRGPTLLTLIADNLAQWGIVVGTRTPIDGDLVGLGVEVYQDGVSVAGHVVPDIDSHFESIARLTEQLASHGRWLNEGDVIITGSFYDVRIVGAGSWQAKFDQVGDVEVRFE